MERWPELREDLRRLRRQSPSPLMVYPDPDGDHPGEERPSVDLAAWASDVAVALEEKYGDALELRLGGLAFPEGPVDRPAPRLPTRAASSIGLDVEAPAPLSVRSGHATTVELLVRNRSSQRRVLSTNGCLQTVVVDDAGAPVATYTGPQRLPLVQFAVEPGGSTRVPALIGTDSVVAALGYAVPPGPWRLVVLLPEGSEGDVVSTPLPLEVTD